MPKENSVLARNRRVERLTEAIAQARRQELMENLGRLFIYVPRDLAVTETNNLIGWKVWPRIARAALMYVAFSEESQLISSGGKVWPKIARCTLRSRKSVG